MPKHKYDVIVEAVRYNSNGQLDWARVYLRRGPTFSDRVLLNRSTLIEQIKSGKKFMSGKRIPLLAGTFDVASSIQLIQHDGKEFIVTGTHQADHDNLEGIPVF